MLRVDLLAQKQAKSTACLQSRKRKLHDLFDATVKADETARQQHEYRTRLQAFFDANDLSKGQRFDENSLPPRVSTPQDEDTSRNLQNSTDTVRKQDSRSRTSTPRSSSRVSSSPRLEHKASVRQRSNGGIESPTNPQPDAVRQHEPHQSDQAVEVVPDERDGPSVSLIEKNKKGRDEVESTARETNGDPDAVEVVIIPEVSETAAAQLEADVDVVIDRANVQSEGTSNRNGQQDHITIPTTVRKSKSPLNLHPVNIPLDPQSSPASSNGAGSSNTPAPTAGSPTTSPGDEAPPAALQIFDASKPADNLTPPDSLNAEPEAPSLEKDSEMPDQADLTESRTAMDVDSAQPEEPASTPAPSSASLTGISTKESMLTRPTMRIDTQSGSSSFKPAPTMTNGVMVESPGSMTGVLTPRKMSSLPIVSQDQSKRSTRISSGVLGRKSVSEILGETPKPASPQIDRSSMTTPSATTVKDFDLASPAGRTADRERRDRERSKLSTVVFAKPQQSADHAETSELVLKSPGQDTGMLKERDYLYTLFESRAYNSRGNNSLTALIGGAHKTISTSDHLIEYQEQMNCRTLKRIYQLQNANRWPLRQIKRADEAPRPTSHWDFLLDHAKWMRTDFREERKWKLAAAKGVAEWCMEWVHNDVEGRKALQVSVKPPRHLPVDHEGEDTIMEDRAGPVPSSSHPTPELVASLEIDSVSDGMVEDPGDVQMAGAPAAIFSLGPTDFNFSIAKTPAADKLLNELPLYEPVKFLPDLAKSDLAERMDARWKKDLLPISKFAEGKIRIRRNQPPAKRSRYDYDLEESPRKWCEPLPPEQTDVALFMPENKHTRDRIHPGHSFRPPAEHPMPTQAFFESRQSSQWTHADDDELRKLVKDYSYNWSLISSCLSPKPMYSGSDRRTPWECFERWIGLEGLPADMSKTPYFRAYHSRIEAAGRHITAQLEAAQRQAGNNVQLPSRMRRTTQPVRVERKWNRKYLAVIDGVRKLAKKRETAVAKQQHAAELAAMRKVNESNQPKPPFRTPAEFSQLKHEREVRSQARAEEYRQQMLAHRAAAAQQARQLGAQVNGTPNNVPRLAGPMPNGVPNVNGVPVMPNGNLPMNQNGQPRPHPGMQGGPNGMSQLPPNLRGGAQNVQQMQAMAAAAAHMQRGQNLSPEQIRMQAEAVKAQQQQVALARAQQNASGNNSSPNMPNASMINGNGNAAYLAALATANGVPSPSMPVNGNAGSPRSNAAMMQGQALSGGLVPTIQLLMGNIRQQNPEMSPEDAQRLATQQLMVSSNNYNAGSQKHRNQAALNAAVGAVNAGSAAYAQSQNQAPMMSNEAVQQYNQRMRQMQQAQQRGNAGMGAGMGPAGMIGGMTGSPILNMSRPVSQHASQGQMSRSATPRDQGGGSQGGMNGGPGQGSPRNGQLQMQT